jgi:hypothetical protein
VEENSFKKTNGEFNVAAARVSNPNELVAASSLQEVAATRRSMRQKKSSWRIIWRVTWIAQVIFVKAFSFRSFTLGNHQ